MDSKGHSSHWRYRLREGLLILTVAASLFIVLALVTYHRSDPSWSHLVNSHHVVNAGGLAGAWLSDLFLYFCGYLAYLFPVVLSYGAWRFYRQREQNSASRLHRAVLVSLRIIGFLLVLASGTGLVNLSIHSTTLALPFSSGGVLGTVVGQSMLQLFNYFGSGLILIAALLIGLTLLTGISWFFLLEKVGLRTAKMCAAFYGRVGALEKETIQARLQQVKAVFSKLTKRKKQDKLVINKMQPAKLEKEDTDKPKALARVANLIKRKTPVIPQQVLAVEESPKSAKPPRWSRSRVIPKLDLLDEIHQKAHHCSDSELEARSREVEQRLQDFGVEVKVVAVYPGPVVTRFELQLAAGTKVSKVSGLALDLARSLSVISVRVVEVIPGKSVIGLELPNVKREMVGLQEVLASKPYRNSHSSLSLALGKDIAGHPVVVDLAKMPHLLVAGTTGSGKSVCLNAMLLSLLYKSTPQQLRMILIDPKMLELAVYDGIPHLLTPVVTDMKDAARALRWSVAEMERRYRLMASLGVRNIAGYNNKVKQAREKGAPLLDPLTAGDIVSDNPQELQLLPQIVVLADEFADMMMVVGKKVETLIARLAQKARAAGVHLILATQRPSVDVITGLIKANIPTRIAFQVSSKIDSRTILDQQGAEHLLGHGDMLYLAPGTGVPVRVHGAFVSDDEVHRVVAYLKQYGEPDYLQEILDENATKDLLGNSGDGLGEGDAEQDPLYDESVEFVVDSRRASVSSLQRRFKIGYNRAACIVEAMEAAGVVSKLDGGTREVLVPTRKE